jgi:hypothetical protein
MGRGVGAREAGGKGKGCECNRQRLLPVSRLLGTDRLDAHLGLISDRRRSCQKHGSKVELQGELHIALTLRTADQSEIEVDPGAGGIQNGSIGDIEEFNPKLQPLEVT